jgi:hypothetical protein
VNVADDVACELLAKSKVLLADLIGEKLEADEVVSELD